MASGVMVVFARCTSGTLDSIRKMQAFEVARENMENLLTANTVSEKSEYGFSEKYPHIEWTTKIESFYEPVNEQMWVKALCSAEYENSDGEIKKVEFTHWLSKLNKGQIKQVLNARKKLEELSSELFQQDSNELFWEDSNL